MILDPDGWGLAQAIESLLADVPGELEGQVKPELFQSVLEIATKPCDGVAEAGRELVALREAVIAIAERKGLAIGAAATHPFARPADQLIVDRPRYHELVDELGIIALHELIFGTHVHVGIEGADRAIYVADGIRRYLPLLLGALGQLAVLAGRAHRADVVARADLPLLPARGHPAPLRHLGDLLPPRRDDDAGGRDRGLHVHVVGRAPAPEPRHRRDAGLRPADAGRAHRLARRAGRQPRASPLRALRRRRAAGRVPDAS